MGWTDGPPEQARQQAQKEVDEALAARQAAERAEELEQAVEERDTELALLRRKATAAEEGRRRSLASTEEVMGSGAT